MKLNLICCNSPFQFHFIVCSQSSSCTTAFRRSRDLASGSNFFCLLLGTTRVAISFSGDLVNLISVSVTPERLTTASAGSGKLPRVVDLLEMFYSDAELGDVPTKLVLRANCANCFASYDPSPQLTPKLSFIPNLLEDVVVVSDWTLGPF